MPRRAAACKQIEVTGHQSEPRCFSMMTADGASSVLLLGAAADEPVPTDVTLERAATALRRT